MDSERFDVLSLESPSGAFISPFHDIPLWANEEVHLLLRRIVTLSENRCEHGL